MANLIQWYGPEIGTSWTHARVFRSATETGVYAQIGTDLPVTTTIYFDEAGASSNWYKIAFYDSVSLVQGPYSAAFYAAQTPTLYCNPTELRKFMQFSVTDFPDDEDVTLLLEQAHVQITDDAAGITNPKKMKLLALLLGSSFVCRSLATKALSKGYIAVSMEGAQITKAFDALMRLGEYYFDKYNEQLAKDTIDFTSTSYLDGIPNPYAKQEILDIQNGFNDAMDVGTYMTPSSGARRGRYG